MKASATENLDYFKVEQNKTWFDEECSKLLDRRKPKLLDQTKQAKF